MAQTVVFSFLPFATQLGLVPITSSWIIPLRLAGLSSPGAPRSLSRPSCCWAPGLGMGLLQRGPGSEPLALTLRRSRSLCHGPGRPSAQTAAYTAGTCVSSVSLLLNVYLLQFPCGQCPPQWPAAAGGGGWHHWQTGHPTGLEGSGIPAPNPALSTRNVSFPVCPLRPPQPACLPALCVPFSPAPAFQQRRATLLGTGDRPRLPLWSCLLAVHIPPSLDIFLSVHEAPAHVA